MAITVSRERTYHRLADSALFNWRTARKRKFTKADGCKSLTNARACRIYEFFYLIVQALAPRECVLNRIIKLSHTLRNIVIYYLYTDDRSFHR